MRCLLTDDANNISGSPGDAETLSDHDLVVPAAEWREPEEALLVDVGNNEANLVDVSGEQDFRCVRRIVPRFDPGKRAANNVVGYLVRERRSFVSPDLSWSRLVAGRARGVQKPAQEGDRSVFHGSYTLLS